MKHIISIAPAIIIGASLLLEKTQATVTLYTTGRQYPTRPASFGMQFEYGLQYEALLQIVQDDEYLCNGLNDTSDWRPGLVVGPKRHGAGRHPGGHVHSFDGGIEEVRVLGEGKDKNTTTSDDMIHVTPSHGVPGMFFIFGLQ